MRSFVAAAAMFGLAISSAQANYLFSGTGVNGNFSGQAGEPYLWNNESSPAPTTANWGSPGVGAGETPYLEAQPAFGFEITFTGGGTIDAASVGIGNGAACVGSPGGGTTFCTATNDIWQAFRVDPHTMEFLAQNATFNLTTGENFFVNIFFDGATPTGFTGAWLTSFSPTPTPLPAALPLFATGLGLVGLLGRLRKRKKADVLRAT
jgi:hypothetical protein